MKSHKAHIKLLDKLIKGVITNEERWMLERTSLDDPFLAEALEGFYDNNISAKDLESIVFLKESKIRYLNPVSIAASIMLLIGIVLVINLQNDTVSTTEGVMMNAELETEDKEIISDQAAPMSGKEEQALTPQSESKGLSKPKSTERTGKLPTQSTPTNKKQSAKLIAAPTAAQKDQIETFSVNTPDDSEDYIIDGVRIINKIEPLEVKGVVMDEEGNAIRGVEVSRMSDARKVQTDEFGEFAIRDIHQGEMIITSFNGYQTDSSVISSDMSIKLRRAESQFSESHKSLEDMMTDNQLINLYKERLDHIFSNEKITCTNPQKRQSIRIQIQTNQYHQIQHLEFIDQAADDCKLKVRDVLENASFEKVFSSDRPLRFIYKLKL